MEKYTNYGKECHMESYNVKIIVDKINPGDLNLWAEETEEKSVQVCAEWINISDSKGVGYNIVFQPYTSSHSVLMAHFLEDKFKRGDEYWDTEFDIFTDACYANGIAFSFARGLDKRGDFIYVCRVFCLNANEPNMASFAKRFRKLLEE